jgi:glucose-1-phosphate thymidylyltransferase
MKGIVLAGGLGSRLLPLTRITNKHLLPVWNQPMVFYPIQKLVEAGITDITIVTGGSHAGDFLRLLRNGKDFGLKRLHYAYQEGEGGIAEALGLTEEFTEEDRVVVILGDNIFEDSIRPYVESYLNQESGAKVLLKEVEHPERFGVAELRDDKIVAITEKPGKVGTPPIFGAKTGSVPIFLAVTGIYMFDSRVYDIIRTLRPSARNELEITDVNNTYLAENRLTYDILPGWWTDAGTFESLYRANVLARRSELNTKTRRHKETTEFQI